MHDRALWLDTSSLDPVTKAAVELSRELDVHDHEARIIRFRNLFQEKTYDVDEFSSLCNCSGGVDCFFVPEYFEDEKKNPISKNTILRLLNSKESESEKKSDKRVNVKRTKEIKTEDFTITDVILDQDQLASLGYFTRDLVELSSSEFLKESPGTFVSKGSETTVKTAATSDEIKSFVTTFRRLYMTREPGSFVNASKIYLSVAPPTFTSLAIWFIDGYNSQLQQQVEGLETTQPISKKLLIDAFIYTQYAHQPNKRRTEQFNRCLKAVEGNSSRLVWLFLSTIWQMTFSIRNAGKEIVSFYDEYIRSNEEESNLVVSVIDNNPGIGSLEKKSVREKRLLQEKAEDIAIELWKEKGRPPPGHAIYFEESRRRLEEAMSGSI